MWVEQKRKRICEFWTFSNESHEKRQNVLIDFALYIERRETEILRRDRCWWCWFEDWLLCQRLVRDKHDGKDLAIGMVYGLWGRWHGPPRPWTPDDAQGGTLVWYGNVASDHNKHTKDGWRLFILFLWETIWSERIYDTVWLLLSVVSWEVIRTLIFDSR